MKRDYANAAARLSAPEISQRLRNAAITGGALGGFWSLYLLVEAIESLNF
jgi:hypothetical protein